MGKMKDLAIDEANRRRGRNNNNRGKAYERAVAKTLGGIRTGMFGGKDDVQHALLAVQAKNGKAYPERIDRWLRCIPTKDGQIQALVIGDAPGAGNRRREIIVMDLTDFIATFISEEEQDDTE
jgi:hypothetical protein